MWRLGFFFHEMAFGLLSVFLPLYLITIGWSLIEIGIMFAVALFLVIPASFFWGYACDKTRRYKRYILISFLASTALLYFFTLTINVGFLIILYAVMSIFHVAHEPPKNVLIAELYSREKWEKSFALYEGFTEIGWLIGLLLGFLAAIHPINPTYIFLLCSGLNLTALVMSLILVKDPLFVFERKLASMEKSIDFAYKGVVVASKMFDGVSINEKLKRENLAAFCIGLALFSLATSALFTPLPIFFSQIARSESIVFAIYALNSSAGIIGYLLISNRAALQPEKPRINRIVILRCALTFLLIAAYQIPLYNVVLATTALILMGFAYAFFLVQTLSLSMELIPEGKTGIFNALVGMGGACGSFIGPYLAQTFGFTYVFLTTGIIFFLAYIAFKIFI